MMIQPVLPIPNFAQELQFLINLIFVNYDLIKGFS